MATTKQQIESAAPGVLAAAQAQTDPRQQLCTIWTGVVRPKLELLKAITGPKVDTMINQVETALDNFCNNTNPDVNNFCNVWNTFHLETVLRTLEIFVGPNVKKAIDKFVQLADSICAK
jgi:hypothetical protein